jgi:hypothetical protein
MAYKIKNKPLKEKVIPRNESLKIPYSDEVKSFANPDTKEIMWIKREYLGKGWYATYVNGKLVEKSRDVKNYSQFVPSGYKEIGLFSEFSYHSPLLTGESRKITNYGTHDYTLQYSDYKPLGKYRLSSPLRTGKKNEFGKVKSDVELQKWNYAVLNWNVGEKQGLQIQHKVSTPYGEKKEIYKSRIYALSEKDKAISDFKSYVNKIKKESF